MPRAVPTAEPTTRWTGRFRDAVVAAIRGYSRHDASQHAAAVAFRVLFSLVPLVVLTVAAIDLVLPASRREEVIDWVIERASASTGLEDSVRRAVEQGTVTPSVAGLVALVGFVWAASGMAGAIRRAFQAIYERGRRRSFVRGKLLDVAVVVGTGMVAVLGFGLGILVTAIGELGGDAREALGLGSGEGLLATVLATAASLAVLFACFAALYRFLPPSPPRWEALWPGAAVGAVGYELATTAYGAYLARFGDLSVVYGSLGAVLGFLLVVWAGSIAMLFGAEIVAGWPERGSRG